MRAHVFLRQPLFTLPAEPHAPSAAAVLVGEVKEQAGMGITLKVDTWLDDRGRRLEGEPRTLLVPATKIDHVLLEE